MNKTQRKKFNKICKSMLSKQQARLKLEEDIGLSFAKYGCFVVEPKKYWEMWKSMKKDFSPEKYFKNQKSGLIGKYKDGKNI